MCNIRLGPADAPEDMDQADNAAVNVLWNFRCFALAAIRKSHRLKDPPLPALGLMHPDWIVDLSVAWQT